MAKLSTVVSLAAIVMFYTPSQALRFYLNDREQRCFKFEAPLHTRILGHASVENGHGGAAGLSVEIRDGDHKVIYQSHPHDKRDASFSFQTSGRGLPRRGAHDPQHPHDEPDEYDYDERDVEGWFSACVVLMSDKPSHNAHSRRAVSFWTRSTVVPGELPNSSSRASNDRVVVIENQLLQMQQTLQGMAAELVALQDQERKLARHNAATGRRLVIYAVIAIVVSTATSALQFSHLVNYFKGKKLL